MDNNEIQNINPIPLPFNADDKIFNFVDPDTGEIVGQPYSYNDWLDNLKNISGINEDLVKLRNDRN